jgi:hypothetical protein
MYTVLKNKLIKIAENNDIEAIQLFDSFIRSFSTSIIDNDTSYEDLMLLLQFTPFTMTLIDLFNEEPFVDHLGRLREELGVKRNPNLTKYSDEDIFDSVSSIILDNSLEVKTFECENCETGRLPLTVMKSLIDDFSSDSLFSTINKLTYQDSYFLLTDECPVAAFTAYIQILLSHQAINQKLDSNSVSLPSIEIIVGDMSYQVKDHQIAFSNTNRELLEIPFIQNKEIYQDDIEITDLENVSANDIQCSSDFTSENETETLMSA